MPIIHALHLPRIMIELTTQQKKIEKKKKNQNFLSTPTQRQSPRRNAGDAILRQRMNFVFEFPAARALGLTSCATHWVSTHIYNLPPCSKRKRKEVCTPEGGPHSPAGIAEESFRIFLFTFVVCWDRSVCVLWRVVFF